jgi:diadenosine tetraphosphate (Ap4A) HIT family hydrolase
VTDCIFCRIVRGELEASFVAEEPLVVAFMDIRAINPGHVLVVPRAHAPLLRDVGDAAADAMWGLARRCDEALRRSGLRCEGVNLFLADGEAAGQEVPHSHLHVVPRVAGDGFGFRFPPGYSIRPRAELEASAAKVRAAL